MYEIANPGQLPLPQSSGETSDAVLFELIPDKKSKFIPMYRGRRACLAAQTQDSVGFELPAGSIVVLSPEETEDIVAFRTSTRTSGVYDNIFAGGATSTAHEVARFVRTVRWGPASKSFPSGPPATTRSSPSVDSKFLTTQGYVNGRNLVPFSPQPSAENPVLRLRFERNTVGKWSRDSQTQVLLHSLKTRTELARLWESAVGPHVPVVRPRKMLLSRTSTRDREHCSEQSTPGPDVCAVAPRIEEVDIHHVETFVRERVPVQSAGQLGNAKVVLADEVSADHERTRWPNSNGHAHRRLVKEGHNIEPFLRDVLFAEPDGVLDRVSDLWLRESLTVAAVYG